MREIIITAVLFGLVALLIAAVIKAECGEHLPGSRPDWTGKVFRPCCKYCAYWMPYDMLCEDTKQPMQICIKHNQHTDWDYCCMDYDGLDTEVQNGFDCDDV